MHNNGLWFALGAYGLWGFLPVYWKFLRQVPALEILFHRMVWSLLFLAIVLAVTKRWGKLLGALSDKRILASYFLASILLAANWGVYIWAVNAGFIVETSLGYFINPLVSVFLGVVVFREKLRVGQWTAIAIAAVGVGFLTWVYGQPPWISLFLAGSFAIYGVLKKVAQLGASEGLTLETAMMFLPALGMLLYWQSTGEGSFGRFGTQVDLLLLASGVATALPLVFFAAAATRLPLSVIGVMQYLAPSIQLVLGVFVYDEPFDSQRLIGFAFIWLALVVYTAEGFANRGQSTPNESV